MKENILIMYKVIDYRDKQKNILFKGTFDQCVKWRLINKSVFYRTQKIQ